MTNGGKTRNRGPISQGLDKWIVIFVTLVLVTSAGCLGQQQAASRLDVGQASGALMERSVDDMGAPAPMATMPSEEVSELKIATTDGDQIEESVDLKIIFTGTIDLEVPDFDAAYEQIKGIVASSDGYISNSNIITTPAGKRRGTITVRVPQGAFNNILETLSAIGIVQSQYINSQDVTLEYTDLESRIKNLKETEIRLISLLDKAANVTEILEIEKELTRVRGEIEHLQGRLNYLSNKVDLATITITLHGPEPIEPDPVEYQASIEVNNLDQAFESVKIEAEKAGGYLSNVQVREEDKRRYGWFTVNVPQNRFEDIRNHLESLGDVSDQELRGVPSKESEALNAVLSVTIDEKESLIRDLSDIGSDFKEALRDAVLTMGMAINGAIVLVGGLMPLAILSAIGYVILRALGKKDLFVWLVIFLSLVFIASGGWIVALLILVYKVNKKGLPKRKKSKKK